MSKLSNAFQNGKVFMAFLTCGDPDLATTEKAVLAAAANGADIIELNIPFSDPTAVDATIQEANIRALEAGVTTDKIFDFVKALRPKVSIPLVFSTYANVVFSYGTERFLKTCQEIGIDGLIVPDLPFEEHDEFLPDCQKYGITLISMISATSKARIKAIASAAEGFLYIMTCPGGTKEQLEEVVAAIRKYTDLPCAVCISAEDAPYTMDTAALCDGIIEDTPIMELMKKRGTAAAPYIGAYIRGRKAMLKAL